MQRLNDIVAVQKGSRSNLTDILIVLSLLKTTTAMNNNKPTRIRLPAHISISYKSVGCIVLLVLLSNITTYFYGGHYRNIDKEARKRNELYLLSEAKNYVYDIKKFENKVCQVSRRLDVPPEWLMAVMHSESRFDASVSNYKGSGATGLIQFMPGTVKDYDVTIKQLRNMNHVEQMDFVYEYLKDKQQRYHDFESLTDMYLAILYPQALAEDFCYTLYAAPNQAYRQNSGLDQDRDGRVTVSDVDKYLKRIYPSAYMLNKEDAHKSLIERLKMIAGR